MSLKLSIITINLNNLDGLKRTVNSVLNQTFKVLEYIVIDGGSTDGSTQYLESIKNKLDFYSSEPDKGVYDAMNKGIKKAKGDYLLFLNSGDHFFNNAVLNKNYHELSGEAIVYFNLNVVEKENSFVKKYPKLLSFNYFLKDTLPHPATFIKKEAFAKTNLYETSFKITADWKFFIDAICKHSLSYKKVDATLSTFYVDGLSALKENAKVIFEEKQSVLNSSYSAYIVGINEATKNSDILISLQKSRIIKMLVKLGFLNKF